MFKSPSLDVAAFWTWNLDVVVFWSWDFDVVLYVSPWSRFRFNANCFNYIVEEYFTYPNLCNSYTHNTRISKLE